VGGKFCVLRRGTAISMAAASRQPLSFPQKLDASLNVVHTDIAVRLSICV
jgi:hypothetical protein